jgi:hypothetical protein
MVDMVDCLMDLSRFIWMVDGFFYGFSYGFIGAY